jgi:hypothetical protein
MVARPERPPDAEYPADELVLDDVEGGGSRRFLSGPLEFGPAMLITPSCSLAFQGAAGYGHAVRTLVPVIPLAGPRGRHSVPGVHRDGPGGVRAPVAWQMPA